MSSLDTLRSINSAPVPAVIPTVPPVPVSSSIPSPSPVSPDPSGKQTIVLCSKKLSASDIDIFGEFGAVVIWQDKYLNVPLSQITPFDYLIGDMTSKNFRLTLGRTDLTQYAIVSYVSTIQKIEDFIQQVPCNNVLTSIPAHAVNKADFDNQLQNAKLVSPSVIKSAFQWVLACLKK